AVPEKVHRRHCTFRPKGRNVLPSQSKGKIEMRKHSIAIAVCAPIAALFSLVANAQAPAVKNLKLQGSWPAGQTIQDHFRGITGSIEKLTGGSIKIETMAAGQVVPPFEVLDATNKKVIDGWHSISYYWVGKSPAAALFAAP